MQDADVILVTVSDDAIEKTSLALCAGTKFENETLIVHTSGCMPAEQLPAAPGTKRGAIHPLAALPGAQIARQRLRETTFAIEATLRLKMRSKIWFSGSVENLLAFGPTSVPVIMQLP